MKVEWWYDDSFIDPDSFGMRDQELILARPTVAADSTAELLFPTGERKFFRSEDEALLWLGDEEYRRLHSLIQDLHEDGRSIDQRIKEPSAFTEAELLRQMRIRLSAK